MWEAIEHEKEAQGIEHCFEFWGTWRIKKAGIAKNYISDSENWGKGIKITDFKSAEAKYNTVNSTIPVPLICVHNKAIAKRSPSQPTNPQLGAEIALLSV